MFTVTVDFDRAVSGGRRTSVIEVVNDGTGDRVLGNYDVRVVKGSLGGTKRREARVENFPRELGAAALLSLALVQLATDDDVDVAARIAATQEAE